MANLQQQKVNASGIYLRTPPVPPDYPEGRSVSITTTDIKRHHDLAPGAEADRYLATRAWIADGLVAGVGPGNLAAAEVHVDFDPATGIPTDFSIGV